MSVSVSSASLCQCHGSVIATERHRLWSLRLPLIKLQRKPGKHKLYIVNIVKYCRKRVCVCVNGHLRPLGYWPLPKLHKCDRGGRDKESVSIHQCSQLTVRAAATTPSTHTLKPWRRIDKRQTPKTYRSVLGQYLPSNAKCKRQPLACLC